MNLKVLLPFRIFADKSGVTRMVAETPDGSFGLLPNRLDCVAALAPGILICESEAEGEMFVAVDEGVLVKTGPDVLVSVRRAIGGTDLAQLREAVEKEFLTLDEHEQSTRRLTSEHTRSRWQNLLEIVVTGIQQQIKEVGLRHPEEYLGFLGTLFLFVATAALCTVIPGYEPPTGSLSTTAALALCVLIAVPMFGIEDQGLRGYLKSYIEPTFIMLPFNIISEVSRTLALAVRLFGNMMSGAMIIGILLSITPFIFPVRMPADWRRWNVRIATSTNCWKISTAPFTICAKAESMPSFST